MKFIEQRYTIQTSPEKVWDALVNPETIKKWGGGPVVMSDKAGTEFSLWGGDVYGKNLEVDKNKKLVQEWYGGEWAYPSTVTFSLSADGHCTEVILVQKDVPENEIKDINEGWRDYYMEPIKKLLEKNKLK
jgi:activator of HSP90 ATPase